MLASGVVVVAVLVSSHGDEGTREEKFRGALVAEAQVGPEVRGTTSPLDASGELATLRADRPTFDGASTLLTVGGVVSVLGLVGVGLTFAFLPALGEVGVFFLVASAGLFGVGLVLGVVAAILMVNIGAKLTRIDARIRELEEAAAQQPVTQLFSLPPRFVLARF
jgi:uncharacterized membrane protein YciS (DUF1049 family)